LSTRMQTCAFEKEVYMFTRFRNRIALVLLFTAFHAGIARAQSAKILYKRGESAEAREDLEAAYQAYGLALSKSPGEIRYKLAMERVRSAAAALHVHHGEALEQQGHPREALVEYLRALEIDPGDVVAQQDIDKTKTEMDKKEHPSLEPDVPNADDLDKPGPPVHLDTISSEPITLHMTEESNTLYQTIGRVAGLNVLIDPEFAAKKVTIDLKGATLTEALRVLGDLSGSFWKASTHNTIYVAPDNHAKRTQLEQLAVRTFYLTNVGQQADLNDVITTLRNVLTPNVKMFAVQSQNAIVVRGTPDEIMLAKSLIASLDLPKAEVLVDVYVMEVSRDKVRNIGISLPTSLTVTSSSTATLNQIGSTSSYSYSIGQAAAELLLTDSDTRVLQNPSLRALDGQRATLKIGEKIPTATGSYTTATSTTTSAVQTQFTYIDVGVSVDMTPTIHQNRDVTLKLAVEVSSQTSTDTIDGVAEPVISQQKVEQVIRLKDGEVNILAGLVQKNLAHNVSGTPGLGELPLIKYMFSTQETEVANTEIVFMLVPHIVRAVTIDAGAAREIDTGSGDSIQIQRVPNLQTPPITTIKTASPRN